MGGEDPELVKLASLMQAYREGVEDIANMELSDVMRVARILELEAKFMGQIEAVRAALERRQAGKKGPN